jgi:hypothetical protein
MPRCPGAELGHDEISGPSGAGGTSEVSEAQDTKLERGVAIKVLPAMAQDPERLARFEQEAKVLASLNHPSIAQIYGIEESSSGRALVMEPFPVKTLESPLDCGDGSAWGDSGRCLVGAVACDPAGGTSARAVGRRFGPGCFVAFRDKVDPAAGEMTTGVLLTASAGRPPRSPRGVDALAGAGNDPGMGAEFRAAASSRRS